ncbi:MAG: isoprenylcysteine carboxylmethyltransferase family protein [Syntrophobacteraceae bacterium]
MPHIIDVGTAVPGNTVSQDDVRQFVGRIFRKASFQLDRLLPIFKNTRILERDFCLGEDWFETERAFPEKNQVYLQQDVELAEKAILDVLSRTNVSADRIGHIFFISSTGISTPTIDAHLFNRIGFIPSVLRTPIWGLGCSGGVAGIVRAADWLRAIRTGLRSWWPSSCAAWLLSAGICPRAISLHLHCSNRFRTGDLILSTALGPGFSSEVFLGRSENGGRAAGSIPERTPARDAKLLVSPASAVLVFLLCQAWRYWCILSLGRSWNTKIIAVPGAELVRAGPYLLFKHPNYAVVVLEIFIYPALFGCRITALILGFTNIFILRKRIRQEEAALGI